MTHPQRTLPDFREPVGKMAVLVIDSDAEARCATVQILQEAGFQALGGGTAAEAIELTHRRLPALVLLEVELPDGNGLDVARELKRDPALVGTFVILVSGTPTDRRKQAEALAEDVADGFITRPVSKVQFLAQVDAFLRIQACQEALRSSEERYKALFDQSLDCVYLTDCKGHFLDANQAGLDLLGYQREDVDTLTVESLLTEDQVPLALQTTEEILTTGRQQKLTEYWLRRKDGAAVLVETTGSLIYRAGQPFAIQGIARDITERKMAEESLQESEERHRTILEAAMDGFWRVDPQGRLLEVNETYCRMSGYSAKELLAMGIPDLEASETASDTSAHIKKIIAQGEDRFESRHRRKDGSIIDVEVSAQYRPNDGESYVVFLRDITNRKQAEEALRQSERRLREAERVGRTGYLDWDLHTNAIIWSDETSRIYGFEPKTRTATLESTVGLVHPEDRQLVEKRLASALSGDSDYDIEHRIVRPDGEIIHVHARGEVTRGSDGEPVRVLGTVVDISERRRAEELLAQAYGRTAAILESISDAFFAMDNDMVVTYFNHAAEAALKRDAKDVVGHKLFDAFPEARGSIFEERYSQALAKKIQLSFETYFGAPPYADWYDVRVYPNPEGISVYFQVITERKRAEEERKRLQEQLAQAQKMESVGRLAGGVAHDFNNLLTVINGYAAFLSNELAVQDPLREYALEIGEAGKRAASLTSQLLAFSRKQVIRPRVINLNDVVANAERMLQRVIGEDILLFTGLAPHLGPVMADPDQIHQVIMNLAVNARDAMPNGGKVEITTSEVDLDETAADTRPDASPGRYVQLAVTDTGTGMTAEVRCNIFEPFFTTKEKGKGTGLGLAMVYGIVRQNDGWIEVESEPGRGSTFRIHLPRIDADEAADEAKPAAAKSSRGDETVLIVEDEEAVRRLAKRSLETHGYHILEAASGAEAHTVASGHAGEIDLLLTDVVMPGVDGRTLSEQLRKLRPNLRVILMSGYAEDVIAHRGAIASTLAYIQKPFNPHELAAKVREILDAAVSS